MTWRGSRSSLEWGGGVRPDGECPVPPSVGGDTGGPDETAGWSRKGGGTAQNPVWRYGDA